MRIRLTKLLLTKKKKQIYFIEISVTSRNRLRQTESAKKRKYELLAREYGNMMEMKVSVIPFVITWDEDVTEFNKRYREQLEVD